MNRHTSSSPPALPAGEPRKIVQFTPAVPVDNVMALRREQEMREYYKKAAPHFYGALLHQAAVNQANTPPRARSS